MTSSKILFFLSISFILGIFLQSVYKIPQIFLWIFLFLVAMFILSFFLFLSFSKIWAFFSIEKNAHIFILSSVFVFCVLFSVLGVLRMQAEEFVVANDKLIEFNGKEEVLFEGVILFEPEARENSQKIKVKAGNSTILITTQKYPEYSYLDKLKITGKLEEPGANFPVEFGADAGNSYKKYLMKDHIYSVMAFPKIETIGKIQPNITQKIYAGILKLKQKFRENIQKNYNAIGSMIMQGMILGDRAAIPIDLKNKFNVTGTSHIIAVSGTHIVILGILLSSFLNLIGIGRNRSFYISFVFICFYILLVGLPPSGVRSAIMAIIFLLGQKIGRQNAGIRMLAFAGVLMLLQNPLLLFYDVGFQLSFLAVLGLIIFEPIIRNLFILFIKSKKEKNDLLFIISATIAAQIFTLPIIVYNFGNVSWVYPITNILIVPVVYLLMMFGFLSVIAGLLSGFISWLLSVPCTFMLWYFLWVVDLFSQPWMSKMISEVHWLWLALYYLIIAIAYKFIKKHWINNDFVI